MSFIIEHAGKTFSPDGAVKLPTSTEDHNRAVEAEQLAEIAMGPERIFAYVKNFSAGYAGTQAYGEVGTWLGTKIGNATFGQRVDVRFGGGSYRRSVTLTTAEGFVYSGWYFESSGDYCRLKRNKVQPTKKGA